MRRIVGCARVRKVAMIESDFQDIRVTDREDGRIELMLSTSSYPAALTIEEARHIGNAILAAADRAEGTLTIFQRSANEHSPSTASAAGGADE